MTKDEISKIKEHIEIHARRELRAIKITAILRKTVRHMAKSCKRYWAFIATLFDLLNPFVIHTMWLYDTGRMVIDLRFYPNKDIEL